MNKTTLILALAAILHSGSCLAQSPDTVVSHEVTGPPHEWTREDMLLAQPMPMSGEERRFVFSHKSVQKLHTWSISDFEKYVSSPIGRQILFGESRRWIDIRSMLRAQVSFIRDFLAGRSKRPVPLPKKTAVEISDVPETGAQSGSDGAPGAVPGSSPGSAGLDDVDGQVTMNLRQNLTADDLFLKEQSQLTGPKSKEIFTRLKKLRTDISEYCKQLDQLTAKAGQSGKSRELEEAMASVIWD